MLWVAQMAACSQINTADGFIWSSSPYCAVKTFELRFKNNSFYALSGKNRCLFSDNTADGFI